MLIRSLTDPLVIPLCSRPTQSRAAFSPLSLFAAGEQGIWLDPSDLLTMFQDAAGTIPVTAADQPVGLIRDKSGRGNHASQSTAASRPMLRNSGTLWWLEFDGVDDFLVSGNIPFTLDKMHINAAIRKTSDAAVGAVMELSATIGANNGTFNMLAPNVAATAGFQVGMKGTIRKDPAGPASYPAPITAVVTGQGDIATGVSNLLVNNVQHAIDSTGLGTGVFGNFPLYIGRRGGSSLPFAGNIYGVIVRGALSDALAVTSANAYLARKSGVTL